MHDRLDLDTGRAWCRLSGVSSTTGVWIKQSFCLLTRKQVALQTEGLCFWDHYKCAGTSSRQRMQDRWPDNSAPRHNKSMHTCLQLAQTELSHLQLGCCDLGRLLCSLLLLLHLLDLCQRSQPLFTSVRMPAGVGQVLLKPAGHGSSSCWPEQHCSAWPLWCVFWAAAAAAVTQVEKSLLRDCLDQQALL